MSSFGYSFLYSAYVLRLLHIVAYLEFIPFCCRVVFHDISVCLSFLLLMDTRDSFQSFDYFE